MGLSWHTVGVVLSDNGKSLERDYSSGNELSKISAESIFSVGNTDADLYRNHPNHLTRLNKSISEDGASPPPKEDDNELMPTRMSKS